jgi:hypothetical protein
MKFKELVDVVDVVDDGGTDDVNKISVTKKQIKDFPSTSSKPEWFPQLKRERSTASLPS